VTGDGQARICEGLGVKFPRGYSARSAMVVPTATTGELVLLFGITVTYFERHQAAEASRLFSILARRVVKSLRGPTKADR